MEHKSKVKIDFLSGFISGFVSVTICSPLDVARTRLNLMQITEYGKNKYKGFFSTLATIYKEEGIKGMYSGYKVTVFATPLFHSLFFSTYNLVKPFVKKWFPERNNFLYTEVTCSLIAGFVSDLLTNPLWVLRTRLQSDFLHSNKKRSIKGADLILNIYRKEGFCGFYKGFGTSLLGLSHAVIYFPLYEYMKSHVKTRNKRTNNSFDIFYISSLCKMFSVTVTYPHIVLRSRMQDKLENKGNLRMMIQRTLIEEGYRGFYAGIKFDLIRVLPNNAIIFVIYEYLRKSAIMKNMYFY